MVWYAQSNARQVHFLEYCNFSLYSNLLLVLCNQKSKKYNISRNGLLALKRVIKDNEKCTAESLKVKSLKPVLEILNRPLNPDEADLKIFAVDTLVDLLKGAPENLKKETADRLRELTIAASQHREDELTSSILKALNNLPGGR